MTPKEKTENYVTLLFPATMQNMLNMNFTENYDLF